jgi:hypothetical protein
MQVIRFKTGDKVQYSHGFLQSTGCDADVADMRGTVVSVGAKEHGTKKSHVVHYITPDGTEHSALSCNLIKAGGFDPTE